MDGLQEKHAEDLDGISRSLPDIMDLNFKLKGRRGERVPCDEDRMYQFCAKHTAPFQWKSASSRPEEFRAKHDHLAKQLHIKVSRSIIADEDR